MLGWLPSSLLLASSCPYQGVRNGRVRSSPFKRHPIILKVNDLDASVDFYTRIMGFSAGGKDGPFTIVRVSESLQLQLAPWGTPGLEHYAFAVSRRDFNEIFARLKADGIDYGPAFHAVGDNTGPGVEVGARGSAPSLYFNDPNKHLIEIRTYDEK